MIKGDVIVERDRVFLLRNVHDKGSLRDVVKGGSWKNAYGRKYAKPGDKQPTQQIARWGRQILEGIAHLKYLGLPYPHLSLTNTLVNADGSVSCASLPPLCSGCVALTRLTGCATMKTHSSAYHSTS